jgi:hypothetical protein
LNLGILSLTLVLEPLDDAAVALFLVANLSILSQALLVFRVLLLEMPNLGVQIVDVVIPTCFASIACD